MNSYLINNSYNNFNFLHKNNNYNYNINYSNNSFKNYLKWNKIFNPHQPVV